MPISSITTARDEIAATLKAAWDPTGYPLAYDDKVFDEPTNTPWAKLIVQHNVSNQVTLGGKVALGGGGTRYRRYGVLTVQIFTPFGGGLTTADNLVDLVVDAFEGESTGSDRVDFTNVTANEVGQNGNWHQFNVVADFQYDRVK